MGATSAQEGRHAEFVFAVSIFPILDATGKVISVAGIGRDITALKETERELVTAREAALAASQAKSEFLSSMSHEIRTPMTAILGMAELLAEGELNAEQRRYIEILGNNGHALLDLINSILDLAKVESGRLTLERVGFDLREVVEKSAQTLAIRAHAKGLELTVSIAPGVPTALLGDPLRLRQVLINLIGNAIKFTEHGEVLVAVDRDYAPDEPIRLKFERARHRDRNCEGQGPGFVCGVLAGRFFDRAQVRRQRARTCDRQAAGQPDAGRGFS